jgi:hypothetical protein
MADDSEKKRLVRFDFPRGASAAGIAQGINDLRRRILDEKATAPEPAAERAAGEARPETPAKEDAEPPEGAAFERPGDET